MAEQSKATPGPWTATDPHKWLANSPWLANPPRYRCCIRYGATNLGNSIAEVYLGGPGALNSDAESVYANARLIAASWELAEALRSMISWARYGEECDPWYYSEEQAPNWKADLAEAEAALKKAGLL